MKKREKKQYFSFKVSISFQHQYFTHSTKDLSKILVFIRNCYLYIHKSFRHTSKIIFTAKISIIEKRMMVRFNKERINLIRSFASKTGIRSPDISTFLRDHFPRRTDLTSKITCTMRKRTLQFSKDKGSTWQVI
jgi:hypothetical protein